MIGPNGVAVSRMDATDHDDSMRTINIRDPANRSLIFFFLFFISVRLPRCDLSCQR